LTNEIYSLPIIEIENPSDVVISTSIEGREVTIKPKSSVIADRFAGAELLHKIGTLIGKEYKPKVSKRKKATKVKKIVKPVKKSKKKKT